VNLVHICDHSNAVYTRVLRNFPHLVTCHDLLAVRSARGEFSQNRTRKTGRLYQQQILRGLTEAAHVACVSSATRRDLLRLTNLAPGKVDLVYNGLNYPYTPLARSEAVKRLRAACQRFGLSESLEAGFILHVGGNQWYKNRPGVIQLYAHLCKKMSAPPKLVMAGKALTPEMRRDISKDSLETRVIELTTVSNEELQTLYCTAGLLLFPSFEEGFGWPIIEAQASGCPVVTVNREPMVEVGGDAAIRFEIDGIGSLDNVGFSNRAVENGVNAVMKVLLESPDERLARIQIGLSNSARFSTDRMLEDYVSLYRRLLKPAGKTSLGKKQPVLAW
jgi:glycosyltransferase involved in cell wall biosynthesis